MSYYFVKGFEREYRTWWRCEHCGSQAATYDGDPPRGKYLPRCELRW